jgi:hypothetical protein
MMKLKMNPIVQFNKFLILISTQSNPFMEENLKENINVYLENIPKVHQEILLLSEKFTIQSIIEPLQKLFYFIKKIPVEDLQSFVVESEKIANKLTESIHEYFLKLNPSQRRPPASTNF